MEPQTGNRISNAIAKACGALAAILGLIALTGWTLELPVLTSLGPGWIPMAPSSALLFVLLGTAVLFCTRVPPSRSARWTGVAFGAAVALIGLLLFFLSYLGIRLAAEHLGFAIAGSVGDAPIGHMAPVTALCFLIAGLSLAASLAATPDRQYQALTGFWLAGLMLFASMVFLLAYLLGTPLFYGGKFIPPALPTSLALAALGAALLALSGPWASASDHQIDAQTRRVSRSFVLVFALMTIGLVSAGGVYFRSNVRQHRAAIELQLSAIADLKVSELLNWRSERYGDATLLYGNPVFADLVRRALASAPDTQARDQLHNWLRQIREAYGYEAIHLIDAQGVARFSVPDNSLTTDELETARQAQLSGKISLDDFHRDEPGSAPRLSLLVPILDNAAGGRPLGIVMLDIDPDKYLYPYIGRWPTPSPSAETLLVRRDGDDVLYLNELRFHKNSALSLRFPLTRTELPAVKAVLGQEGIVEGRDYRGVPVIAAIRAVPGTPWFLVARIDTDEFLASTEESLWLTAGLIAGLLLFSGAALALIWRHQRLRHYSERTRAAEALAAGSARYQAVTETAADAIVTADRSGTIAGWNASAERIFGYTETEAVGQPLTLLIPERFQDRHLDGMKRMQSGGERHVIGKTVELVGRRRDASEFPLDLSLAEWAVGEGRFFTANIRDITERKAADARIVYLNRVYAVLSGINTVIVRVRDRDELFREACRIAVEAGGFRMSLIGIVDRSSMKIVPIASAGVDEEFLTAIKGFLSSGEGTPEGNNMVARAMREKTAIVSNDSQSSPEPLFRKKFAEYGIRSAAWLPLMVSDEAIGVIALYASEIEFFQEEELKLLTELAGDIAFAIDHIDKQERLDYLAYYDELTGLANRTLFLERVAQYLHSAASGGHKLAVALIDLERFKNINDSLGQPAGDELLRQVAQWLTGITGDASLLARVGADHFAGVLPQVKQGGDVVRLLEKTMEAFQNHPFHLNDSVYRIAAKVGVALFPDDGADAETLFRSAEAALKKAKARGDRYRFYTQKMTEAVADKLTLENQLRQALDKGEFVLHYQPKVNLASGKMTSAEALIRWNDPRNGLVPPGRFIPILEETGMIYEVGRWALRQAIADYLRWRAAGLPAVRIAVNVSPLQLRHHGFIAEIEQAIGIDPQAAAGLELEITESLLMENIKYSIASLQAIHAMGISIAIDDFGTGFSSLSYLAKLPLDTLKIDRSFVLDMTTSPQGLALVSTIISLAHALKLKVVAEGIETEEQQRLLHLLDCDEMQGFLFSKPVPGEIFEVKFLAPASDT